MSEPVKIDDRITVGPTKIDADRIAELAAQGFKTIVNLRTEAEKEPSPAEEGDMVRGAGLHYVHIPVNTDALNIGLGNRFHQEVSAVPGPVYVHCAAGKRAGTFATLHAGLAHGWTTEQTLAKAAELGFTTDSPKLEAFLAEYMADHSSA